MMICRETPRKLLCFKDVTVESLTGRKDEIRLAASCVSGNPPEPAGEFALPNH